MGWGSTICKQDTESYKQTVNWNRFKKTLKMPKFSHLKYILPLDTDETHLRDSIKMKIINVCTTQRDKIPKISSTETASWLPQLSWKYRKQNSRNRIYCETFISGSTKESMKKMWTEDITITDFCKMWIRFFKLKYSTRSQSCHCGKKSGG